MPGSRFIFIPAPLSIRVVPLKSLVRLFTGDFWQRAFYFLGNGAGRNWTPFRFYCYYYWCARSLAVFSGPTWRKSRGGMGSQEQKRRRVPSRLFLEPLTHGNRYSMVCLVVAVVHFCLCARQSMVAAFAGWHAPRRCLGFIFGGNVVSERKERWRSFESRES